MTDNTQGADDTTVPQNPTENPEVVPHGAVEAPGEVVEGVVIDEPIAETVAVAPVAPATAPTVEYAAQPVPVAAGAASGAVPPADGAHGAHAHTGESFSAPKPRNRTAIGLVAALAVGALIGGVSGAGVTYLATANSSSSQTVQTTSPAAITVNDTDDVSLTTAVAANASPSVVTISVTSSSASGTGSGVVIDDEGHIITNAHVVTLDGGVADPTIFVTTSDGRLLPATVTGVDPINDIAVIQVDAAAGLPALEFADSDNLNVGERAIAIGAPLGFSGSVTDGIISALHRSITVASSALPEETADPTVPEDEGSNPYDFWLDIPGQQQTPSASSGSIFLSVIQTDAAINPGNSGGALLDSDGRLIGINVAIASAGGSSSDTAGSIGLGFAIPANTAKRIAEALIADGTVSHGLLGASVVTVTGDATTSSAGVVGASIQELTQGGAAAAGGLQVGDIVTAFDGVPISSSRDLTAQVRSQAAGAEVTVTYVRDGKTGTVDVTLGELR